MIHHWRHRIDRDGDICIVTLSGEIDMAAGEVIAQLLAQEINTTASTVRVDLEAVTFIDSCAIGVLVEAYRTARATGRHFIVTAARGHVRKVLGVTGVLTALSPDTSA